MRLLRGGTLRRCTPTCRLARAWSAGRGRGPLLGRRRGKTSGKGAAGGPCHSRRLALYSSRIGVGDVGALRLLQCALYSPTLKESHALTSSSSTRRRGPWREESVRERFTRRPPSERTNLRGTSDRASRERILMIKWDLFEDFSETLVNR